MLDNRWWARYLAFIKMCDGQTYNDVYYYELHHIIPKSLGGDDSKDNLIKLTARQHFIAHVLLFKSTKSAEMAFAVRMMSNSPQQGRFLNSKEFEIAREISKTIKFSKETKLKMSKSAQQPKPWLSERNKQKTGRTAFRSDNRLLWFYNEELSHSIFITRLEAKTRAKELFGFSGVTAKRLYTASRHCNQDFIINGWTCRACLL